MLKVIMLVMGMALIGCAYEKESDVLPDVDDCDSDNVSYSVDIAPIMQNYCNSCHNESSPIAGVATDSYDGVQTIALSGYLWGSVNHDAGFATMPQNQAKLSDCELEIIRSWIDDGVQNN